MASLRLTKEEQRAIDTKRDEVNRALVNAGEEPITNSELVHMVLTSAIEAVNVDEDGDVLVFLSVPKLGLKCSIT